MPEGPEVEYTLEILREFEKKKIMSIELTNFSQKYSKYKGKQNTFNEFSGSVLKKIERQGKFLIWIFSIQSVVLNHLGMSGKWVILENKNEIFKVKHAKIIINFDKINKIAIFDDARNFGQFRIFDSYESVMKYSPIKILGLDGLAIPFPLNEFEKKLKQNKYRDKEIGKVLLDQSLVAGIGNIYKSESLSLAKLSPLRIVQNLTFNEIEKLGLSVSEVLHKAVRSMGSSIQNYRTPYGEEGTAQNWHKVYGKEGEKCEECGSKIKRIIQNKRSTFYCEKCQK